MVAVNGPGQSFGEAVALGTLPMPAPRRRRLRAFTLDAERLRSRLTADPDLAFLIPRPAFDASPGRVEIDS